ncbi:MAG: carbohydrate kinase, partial [Gemmataceae bacterium]
MITPKALERMLSQFASCRIGVFGDLFLDRYLAIDAGLDEPSIETGLTAYQVVQVRSQPGASGTVINNLHALGVGQIEIFSMRGDDGEGYELAQALSRLKG